MPGSITKVSICNLALARLGIARIISLDDQTPAARACKELFDSTHRWLLREHGWTFAMKYAELAQESETGANVFDYDYAYQLPTDCLFVLNIDSETVDKFSPYAWEVRGRTLVTDVDTVKIRYVHFVDDFSLITPEYESLLGWALAEQMAMPLTKSIKMVDRTERRFQRDFLSAVGADSAHGTGNSEDTGGRDLLLVRSTSGSI